MVLGELEEVQRRSERDLEESQRNFHRETFSRSLSLEKNILQLVFEKKKDKGSKMRENNHEKNIECT